MADYKISIGAELRTQDIDKEVKSYKGNIDVGVNANSIISDINSAINGYKASQSIEVESKLNTQGITDDITKYSKKGNRKKIQVDVDPQFTGVEGKIEGHVVKTPLKVGVDLNWAGVAKQIANPNFGTGGTPKLNLEVDLNDDAIISAINRYTDPQNSKVKTIPIKIKPDFSELNWNQVETMRQEPHLRSMWS